MIIPRRVLEQIAAGTVTLAFRRWRRPTVRAGGTLRTAIGVLAIDALDPVDEPGISPEDARRAGFASRDALLAELARRPDGRLHRIALRLSGPDPRVALRARSDLDDGEAAEVERRLTRLDAAGRRGPWTADLLRMIAARPAVQRGRSRRLGRPGARPAQGRRAQAEGAGAHREPGGRLPALAARRGRARPPQRVATNR